MAADGRARSRRSMMTIISRVSVVALLVTTLAARVERTNAFEIDLLHRGDGDYDDMKCVSEEIHKDAVVVFSFDTVIADDKVSLKLFDSRGRVVFEEKDVSEASHGFTSETEGEYRACFYKPEVSSMAKGEEKKELLKKHRVRLDWKHGVAATEWKKLAKATDVDAFTRTLRMLEADMREVHDGMLRLRALEAEMRDMNEATNSKVAWLSVLSLSVCVGMCVWQIVHLSTFFERKKLL